MEQKDPTEVRTCRTVLAGKYLRELTVQGTHDESLAASSPVVSHTYIHLAQREFSLQIKFPELRSPNS